MPLPLSQQPPTVITNRTSIATVLILKFNISEIIKYGLFFSSVYLLRFAHVVCGGVAPSFSLLYSIPCVLTTGGHLCYFYFLVIMIKGTVDIFICIF